MKIQIRLVFQTLFALSVSIATASASSEEELFWKGYRAGCDAANGVLTAQKKCTPSGSSSNLDALSEFMGRGANGGIVLGGSTGTGKEVPAWAFPSLGGGTQSDKQVEQILEALQQGQKAYAEGYRLQDGIVTRGRVELEAFDSGLNYKADGVGAELDWQPGVTLETPPDRELLELLQNSKVREAYILQGVVVE